MFRGLTIYILGALNGQQIIFKRISRELDDLKSKMMVSKRKKISNMPAKVVLEGGQDRFRMLTSLCKDRL